jgi:glutamyl-tRNA synthetase
MAEDVRLRFPPSPTGYLHIGGARTALLNWLYARKHGGKLILRIEDTDAERSTEESIQGIIDGMKWLGIDWDEGPYFQTEFEADHKLAAETLLKSGHAYKCFCTKEDLDAKRETAMANKTTVGYDKTCRNLNADEIKAKEDAGLPFVVRMKVPSGDGFVSYDDKVLGTMRRNYADIEDFVVVRSNGKPLYLLCNVVDDIRDRISHVVRGQDHLTNTHRQILVYEALGAKIPIFAHMPLTLDTKKKKISKRSHGEIVAVQWYRKNGFLPWALCNFLVLLGWASGDDKEIFSKEELIEAFTLERINKSNSIFNYRKDDPKFITDPKLLNTNAHYLRTMDLEELAGLVKPLFEDAGIWQDTYLAEQKEWFLTTLDMTRERFYTLHDFAREARGWFSDDFEMDAKALKKNVLKHEGLKEWLPELAEKLEELVEFTADSCKEVVKAFCTDKDIKMGIPMNGSRAVLLGQIKGPSMFEVFAHLGKETVVRRLQGAGKWF